MGIGFCQRGGAVARLPITRDAIAEFVQFCLTHEYERVSVSSRGGPRQGAARVWSSARPRARWSHVCVPVRASRAFLVFRCWWRETVGGNAGVLVFGCVRFLVRIRYSFMGGFDGTSNVAAGKRFAMNVRGTHAHSFVSTFTSFDDLATREIEVRDRFVRAPFAAPHRHCIYAPCISLYLFLSLVVI